MMYSIVLLSIALLNMFLGLFVLSRNAKQAVNRTFCYWTFSMAVWNFMDFGLSLSKNPEFALKFAEVMLIGVFFIPSTFYHFVVSLLKEKGKNKVLFYPYWLYYKPYLYSNKPLGSFYGKCGLFKDRWLFSSICQKHFHTPISSILLWLYPSWFILALKKAYKKHISH